MGVLDLQIFRSSDGITVVRFEVFTAVTMKNGARFLRNVGS
jgi:hypothetical protein